MKPRDDGGGDGKDASEEPRNRKDRHLTLEARRGEEGLVLLGWIFSCWATSTGAVFLGETCLIRQDGLRG